MSEELADLILANGPIHKLAVEFEPHRFRGEILPELERLKELGIVRVIDLLAVRKDHTGSLAVLTTSDLAPDEAVEFGAAVGTLIGLGVAGREGAQVGARLGAEALADGHVFDASEAPAIAAMLTPGSTYVILLLEHRWAIPLRQKIARAGGSVVAEEWVGIENLIALGFAGSAGRAEADASADTG
jgi:hypothetical protein